MKRKQFYIVGWMLILSMLCTLIPISAHNEDTQPPDVSVTTEEFAEFGSDEMSVMSIAQPVKAYLVVNTNCYLAPNPNLGHTLGAIPINTDVWVVEKAKCPDNNMYYYYCGFTYNGASHRGYFSSDNVYRNGSRYMPADVVDEYRPAYSKEYTSVAGTVYAGPGTTYATVGTVGQETVKLIRTEGNYNFIQYTVTSTGKIKRGFLHYSNITGSWANLTAQNAELDGQTFYIRRGNTAKYWGTVSNSSAENTRIQLQDFTGNTGQIYKFIYNSTGKYFYIQPAVGYNTDRRVEIQWDSGIEHENRQLYLKSSGVVLRQQFWVIKMSNGYYKFVPRSSYGTMALSARSGYVNQYYTSQSAATDRIDIWKLEDTMKFTSTAWVSQEGKNWCWAASAKMLASSEDPQNFSATLTNAIIAVVNDAPNTGQNETKMAQVANYIKTGNINSNDFYGFPILSNYSEATLRKFIVDDHSISIIVRNTTLAHALNIIGFAWNENTRKYDFCYYDPADPHEQMRWTDYSVLRSYNSICSVKGARWEQVIVYKHETYYDDIIAPIA